MDLLKHLRSIAWQTRIAMSVSGFLVIVLLAYGWNGLKHTQHAQRMLSERAIPELERIEVLSSQRLELDALFARLLLTTDQEEQSQAFVEIQQLAEEMRQTVQLQPQFAALLASVSSTIEQVAALQSVGFALRDDYRAIIRIGGQNMRALVDSLDTIISDKGFTIEKLLLTVDSSKGISSLSSEMAVLNTISQLELLATNINASTISLGQSVVELEELEELEERNAVNFRSMIKLLVQLPPSDTRRDLSVKIATIRDYISSKQGLIALRKAQLENDVALSEYSERYEQLNFDFLRLLGDGIDVSRARVEQSTLEVENATNAMFRQFAFTGGLSLALLGTIAVFLVERRILGRLRRLANAVRKIAAGDIDAVVDVRGADELGEMADALQVFKKNSRELTRSNEELARFGYAASHDLRSPLRSIHDLAQWTIEDAGDLLPPDCRKNMDLLISRADRLSSLLTDMLNYARVGQETADAAQVNIEQALDETWVLLGASDGVKMIMSGAPKVVTTYKTPFFMVLMNLIGNALKHGDAQIQNIWVTWKAVDERLHVQVRDDGPGIAPEYHTRIFELFETLQSRDRVEGSGMGLAIIRKLVEQYNGKIEVFSNPATDVGAAFSFDWPIFCEN